MHVCCKKYVSSVARAINMASLADKHLPTAGGMLDQSAWFIDLWISLQNDSNKLESERIRGVS